MTSYQFFQVHIMLTGGIFFLLLTLLLALNDNFYDKKKPAIIVIELSSAILLFADSIGCMYEGDAGLYARFFLYFCNFLVFLFTIFSGFAFVSYFTIVIFDGYKQKELPKRLIVVKFALVLGIMLVFVMTFTGKYFYIDSNNFYQRGDLFWLSYIAPFFSIAVMMTVMLQYGKNVSKMACATFWSFIIFPLLAGVVQYFLKGQFLIDLFIGVSACFLYAVSVVEQNRLTVRNVFIDVKTGISNCYGFMQNVEGVIKNGKITEYDTYYFDLMRFGNLNNKYGHEVTDEIIREYVSKITKLIESDEYLGRLGGNYFVALIKTSRRDEFIKVMEGVPVEIEIDNKVENINISAVAGGYRIDNDNVTPVQLIDFAAMALSLAKHTYNRPYLFFTDDIKNELFEIQKMEQQILAALDNHEFVAYYQPKVNCREKKLCGAEALARWKHDGELISPARFIPIMERNDSICQLDFYMLDRVCKDISNWISKGYDLPCVSVNFSRKNLGNPNLAQDIYKVLQENGVPADKIEIEITETIDEYSIETLRDFVEELHKFGIKVAIDDFGVGSSSMNLLREVIFDVLKIDKTFVDNSSEKEMKILKHIVGIAKDTGAHVISEGVERKEQCDILLELGCEEIQGFIFDKPLCYEDFEERLKKNHYQ